MAHIFILQAQTTEWYVEHLWRMRKYPHDGISLRQASKLDTRRSCPRFRVLSPLIPVFTLSPKPPLRPKPAETCISLHTKMLPQF